LNLLIFNATFLIDQSHNMGASKTEIFNEHQNKLACMAKALAHPARIAILEHLIQEKRCFCGDLVNEIGLAQATVSQHLKELKNLGIVQCSESGTCVCYSINVEIWAEIKLFLGGFLNSFPPVCDEE
jgi:DNA-binding transcriptional ArsR family regulator